MENDDVPMLPVSNTSSSSRTMPFTSRSRSISLANTSSTIDVFNSSSVDLGYTDPVGTQRRPPLVQMSDPLSSTRSPGAPFSLPAPYTGGFSDFVGASSSQPGKHEHHLKSGKLGMCNDPYCTTCPPDYNHKAAQIPTLRVSATSDSTVSCFVLLLYNQLETQSHNVLDDDAKGWDRRFVTYSDKYLPRIINPDYKYVRRWTTFFVGSCLLSIFVDPLFFYPIEVYKDDRCIKIDWPTAKAFVAVRTITDVLFCVNILLQFRLAYVAPESTVIGSGELVYDPIKIASRYCRGKFFLDLFIVLPIPQRVNQCLRNACSSNRTESECRQLIDCGRENITEVLEAWKTNANASACFQEDGFNYGIYLKTVNLTCNSTVWYTRYSYSLFWGFQNFLQSLGRRDTEMTLRRREVEQWMSHRRFPEGIKQRVKEVERFNWSATKGVNEESLFENMPDDLQIDIRRHLFTFIKKVRMFSKMDESILDDILERLKQSIYLKGSLVLRRGGLVKKIVFVVRGKMESTGEDNSVTPLFEGDVCGEELLTWFQERSSVNPGTGYSLKVSDGTRIRMPSNGLRSNRDVKCVTDVAAFSLSVADLEDVVTLFPDSRDS
ncbi:hypothetical protein Bca4012_066683 [Brassica carinata]